MNTELKNAVLATDLKAQYDACAKKLLGYKDILARILIEAVEEFIFYVSLKAGRSKIIINVEAQRKEPAEYDILNRTIFYVSREISSQKNREFVNSNYNDIKKGKQLKFLRVSCDKLERFRSFVRSRETETSLFSKNANL